MKANKVIIVLSAIAIFVGISCKPRTDSTNKGRITLMASQPTIPVLSLKPKNKIIQMRLNVPQEMNDVAVTSIEFDLKGTTELGDILALNVYSAFGEPNFTSATQFGSTVNSNEVVKINGTQVLQSGDNFFWLSARLSDRIDLSNKIKAVCKTVQLSNGETLIPNIEGMQNSQRIGVAVRQKGQDSVHTYRIPGLETTNQGSLIAVYDVRHSQGADLQGDIDVGMSRSTDGGISWEPMKIIMDMGEYGGRAQEENGIGDPTILVDRKTNTIWVAALWLSGHKGKRNWFASESGMSPEETGQFILVKSVDDGLTWSEPINITEQIKRPEWQLFFNGPGKGITLKDGTLVFPAQFKDKEKIPYSTIVYSKNGGKTWNVGTGAKSETTEAQVVELLDGSLMLNMRDNRNGKSTDGLHGRSVAITKNLGKTWTEHPTSRKALPEPVCMASIVSYKRSNKDQVLFFSNPNSTTARTNMTIKTSFDQGLTWPKANQLEIYEEKCYGYSCMTLVDENHIGILYEGIAELYFEKIPIGELLGKR